MLNLLRWLSMLTAYVPELPVGIELLVLQPLCPIKAAFGYRSETRAVKSGTETAHTARLVLIFSSFFLFSFLYI